MKNCKVYKDGMHYIAIRHTEGKSILRLKKPPEEPIEVVDEYLLETAEEMPTRADFGANNETVELTVEGDNNTVNEYQSSAENNAEDVVMNSKQVINRISTRSDEFLKWYRESFGMRWAKRRKFIASKLNPYFENEDELYYFIDSKLQARRRAEIIRRIRCYRRASLHDFNYFVTFTYDSKKVTEAEFQKKLLNTLRHFASRKGWKYMGTWERGSDTDRLHFHALMYIPEDKLSGEIVTRREYDVKKKRMVEFLTNTFFEDRFGRNMFQVIDGVSFSMNTAIEYVIKYLEKDGGRIICSRGLKTFLLTDIDNEDIITRLREDNDTKYILFDDFMVYKDGVKLGKFSPSLLEHANMTN